VGRELVLLHDHEAERDVDEDLHQAREPRVDQGERLREQQADQSRIESR